jgi:SPP1 gp7 family putative phage head morphogenesis protein
METLAGALEADKLDEWGASIEKDPQFAALVYQTLMTADMGGQLVVRTVEVPESAPRSVPLARVTGDAFFAMPFEEAIREFLARRLITPAQYRRLSAEARARAFSVSNMTSTELVRRVREILADQLNQGVSLREFTASVRAGEVDLGVTPTSSYYLENIFRTNTQSAYGAGRLRQITAPEVMAARPFVEYRTAGDNRVRPNHAALNRMVFRQTDPAWQRYAPPLGYQCFVGSTPVAGSFLAAVRALYTGEFVELRTHSGRSVTVTANHPLATVDGFVPANSIHEGDEVLCHQAPVWTALDSEIDPENRPSSAEQVFRALPERNRSKLRVMPEDFHGEAKFWNGDVDAVTADGMLLNNPKPEAAKDVGDVMFAMSNERAVGESCGGSFSHGFGAPNLSPGSAISGRDLPPALLDGHLRPLDPLRVGLTAGLPASGYEPSVNDSATDSIDFRELIDRSSGVVALEKVVYVRKFFASDHVYDLQSDTGLLVAGGIVTSNCRCAVVTRRERDVDLTRVVDASTLPIEPDPGFGNPRL